MKIIKTFLIYFYLYYYSFSHNPIKIVLRPILVLRALIPYAYIRKQMLLTFLLLRFVSALTKLAGKFDLT